MYRQDQVKGCVFKKDSQFLSGVVSVRTKIKIFLKLIMPFWRTGMK